MTTVSTADRFAALYRTHVAFAAALTSLAGWGSSPSAPNAAQFASGTLALVVVTLLFVFVLLATAAALDAAAAPLFRDALAADEDVRLLARLARL